MKCLLHIGPDNSKGLKHLPDLTKALLAVMNAPAGDTVKLAAIGAIQMTSATGDVTVTNSNFQGKVEE